MFNERRHICCTKRLAISSQPICNQKRGRLNKIAETKGLKLANLFHLIFVLFNIRESDQLIRLAFSVVLHNSSGASCFLSPLTILCKVKREI